MGTKRNLGKEIYNASCHNYNTYNVNKLQKIKVTKNLGDEIVKNPSFLAILALIIKWGHKLIHIF